MANIKIDIDDGGLQRKLNALQAAATNKTPLYTAIGVALSSRIRLCFKLGIDPWGNPWAALKMRKGQPLRDTGRLQRSITSRADGQGVTVGTNVTYAPVQQFGATIAPKKAKRLVFPGPSGKLIFAKKVVIPSRKFLPLRRDGVVELPPSWAAIVRGRIRAYLLNAANKA